MDFELIMHRYINILKKTKIIMITAPMPIVKNYRDNRISCVDIKTSIKSAIEDARIRFNEIGLERWTKDEWEMVSTNRVEHAQQLKTHRCITEIQTINKTNEYLCYIQHPDTHHTSRVVSTYEAAETFCNKVLESEWGAFLAQHYRCYTLSFKNHEAIKPYIPSELDLSDEYRIVNSKPTGSVRVTIPLPGGHHLSRQFNSNKYGEHTLDEAKYWQFINAIDSWGIKRWDLVKRGKINAFRRSDKFGVYCHAQNHTYITKNQQKKTYPTYAVFWTDDTGGHSKCFSLSNYHDLQKTKTAAEIFAAIKRADLTGGELNLPPEILRHLT